MSQRAVYIVSADGISQDVIEADIRDYLGASAQFLKRVQQNGRECFQISATSPLSPNQIATLKANSSQWRQHRDSRYRGYSYAQTPIHMSQSPYVTAPTSSSKHGSTGNVLTNSVSTELSPRQFGDPSGIAISSYGSASMSANESRNIQTSHTFGGAGGKERRGSDVDSAYGSLTSSSGGSNYLSRYTSATSSSSYEATRSMPPPSSNTRRPSFASNPSDEDDNDRMYGWRKDEADVRHRQHATGLLPSPLEEEDDDHMYGWRKSEPDQSSRHQPSSTASRRR